MICLDTNAVIEAINQRRPEVRARLEVAWAGGEVIGLPAVVVYELWVGVKKSERIEANARRLRAFLTLDFEVWAFGAEDAEEAATIRAGLERVGAPIGAYGRDDRGAGAKAGGEVGDGECGGVWAGRGAGGGELGGVKGEVRI